MLSLEINVSQLQPSQMSGLAMLLNSLMRGAAAEAGVPPVPAASYAQVGAPYVYPPPQAQTQQQQAPTAGSHGAVSGQLEQASSGRPAKDSGAAG